MSSINIQWKNLILEKTLRKAWIIYKIKNDLFPKMFSDFLGQTEINPYNLRILHDFKVLFVKSVYYESKSISYPDPKIY